MSKYANFEKTHSVEPVVLFPPCDGYIKRLLANPDDTKLTSDKRLDGIKHGLENILHVITRDLAMPLSTRGKMYPYLHEFKQFAAYQRPGVIGTWLLHYAQNLHTTVTKLQRHEPTTPAEEEKLRTLVTYAENRAKHIAKTKSLSKRVNGKSVSETGSTFSVRGSRGA